MIRPTDPRLAIVLALASCSGDAAVPTCPESCASSEQIVVGCACVPLECALPVVPDAPALLVEDFSDEGDESALLEALENNDAVVLGPGEWTIPGAELAGKTIVGACPDLVSLRTTDTLRVTDRLSLSALRVRPAVGIEVAGGELDATDTIFDLADATGLVVTDGSLRLRSVAIVDVDDRGITISGGTVTLDDVAISGASGSLSSTGLLMTDGEVSLTAGSLTGLGGPGLDARGGTVSVVGTGFQGVGGGVVASNDAEVTLDQLIVSGSRTFAGGATAAALRVSGRARVTASAVELVDNLGPGAVVANGGTLSLSDANVIGNTFAGVWVADATARLVDVVIRDNGEDPAVGGGVGVGAADTTGSTRLTWSGGTAGGHPVTSVYVSGPGTYALTDLVLEAGPVTLVPFVNLEVGGHSLVATGGVRGIDQAAGLSVERVTLTGYLRPGALLDNAEAFFGPDCIYDPAIVDPELRPADIFQQACPVGELGIGGGEGAFVVGCVAPDEALVFERVELTLIP